MKQPRLALVVLSLVFALGPAAGAAAQDTGGPFRITGHGVSEAVVLNVSADLAWAEDRIATMLGRFPDTVSVQIFAHREGFTVALREAWGIPETACWMVGAADDYHLYLLEQQGHPVNYDQLRRPDFAPGPQPESGSDIRGVRLQEEAPANDCAMNGQADAPGHR